MGRVQALLDECHEKGTRFIDPDFDPVEGDHSLLYMEKDIVSAEEAQVINKLKWLRPDEISNKRDIIGFF